MLCRAYTCLVDVRVQVARKEFLAVISVADGPRFGGASFATPYANPPTIWRRNVTVIGMAPADNSLGIEVTLTVDPARCAKGQTTGNVATRLVDLGGTLFAWSPDMNGNPAKASFRSQTQAEHDRFVADALKIPGVSLGTPL